MRSEVDKVNQIPADPAQAAFDAMHAILHLYRGRRQRLMRSGAHDDADELAHMEMKALGYFARHPGATQSDLVAHSGRDKGQVARLIRTLRERGLLDGEADERDKRSTRLRLSDAGRAAHAAFHRHDGEVAEAALADLNPTERAVLAALLARVRANLDAADG